ncbi:winged helix-turn-helix transcriptional regulator [Sneathiella aquimaris]|uniref:winged helix-turn-helix transcriptional regulator n=1 Tax=Sneathiella aquimaris TaxID=2599305 RepID=UPI00146B59B2|nr:helix-turn-helix domain-containing protein [Sneathiella aquimaris]
MRWEELSEQNCSVARSLAVFGDRWTLLILRNCFLGVKRFDDFLEDLDLSRTILTDRLNKLVEQGVLKKVPYQEKPVRYDYKLTEKGLDLHSVIMAIVAWGDRHYAVDGEPPVIRTHTKCGKDFNTVTVCTECGEPVTAHDVKVRSNPKAGLKRA